jgi:hypothetical protein
MKSKDFINNCDACGGNWAAMLLSGLKKCFPEYFATLENKEYSFEEVFQMTVECGVNWDD